MSAKPTAKPKPKAKPDRGQGARFIETARELEVDEAGEAFEKAIRSIMPKVGAGDKQR